MMQGTSGMSCMLLSVCAALSEAHRLSGLPNVLWQNTGKGIWRRALTISAIGACGSVADGVGCARVEQATQGRRGAQLAAQKEPLPLPRLRCEKQKGSTCKEGGRAEARRTAHSPTRCPSSLGLRTDMSCSGPRIGRGMPSGTLQIRAKTHSPALLSCRTSTV